MCFCLFLLKKVHFRVTRYTWTSLGPTSVKGLSSRCPHEVQRVPSILQKKQLGLGVGPGPCDAKMSDHAWTSHGLAK